MALRLGSTFLLLVSAPVAVLESGFRCWCPVNRRLYAPVFLMSIQVYVLLLLLFILTQGYVSIEF